MPKRPQTPPPPDDEPRYLTVVHPYPLNANLMLHEDRRTLALWLACCTGKDVLLAMFHKPSSPGMVIIEVNRDFDGRFDLVLGTHQWSAFLKKPKKEEEDKASKVFYCRYNTGRLVEKYGWKRVYIEEHWFDGWSPSNSRIKHPYPKTSYCDVPREAQTGEPLCRPLPRATFPPPPPPQRPIVGSTEWFSAKSSNTVPSFSSKSSTRGGLKSAPNDGASVISVSSTTRTSANYSKGGPSPRPAPSPIPTSQISSLHGKQSAWGRVPPPAASIALTATSRAQSHAHSTIGSRAYTARGAAPPPTRPPGLPHPSRAAAQHETLQFGKYERFDWGHEVEELEVEVDDEPTTPSVAGGSIDLNSGRFEALLPRHVPEPHGAIDADQEYDYDDDDVPKRSVAGALEGLFGIAPKPVHLIRQAPPVGGDEVGQDENVWGGYARARKDPPTKINLKAGEIWECPKHGPLCNPGICRARYKVDRDRWRAKEREERDEARKIREERWERKKQKEERKRALEESSDQGSGSRSSHSGSSKSGDSDNDGSSDTEGDIPRILPSRARTQSPEPHIPLANANQGDLSEDENWLWGDQDDKEPKVNIARNAWSTTNTDVDSVDETRSVTSAGTSSTAFTTSSSSRSRAGDSSPQLSGKPRGSSSSRTTSSVASTRGNKAVSAKPTTPGLGQSAAQYTGGRASTRTEDEPPIIDDLAIWGDAVSIPQLLPLEQRQPLWDSRSERSNPLDRLILSRPNRSASGHSVAASSSSGIVVPEGGFPTYSGEKWADPIAASQHSRAGRKKKKRFSGAAASSGAEKAGGESESEKAEEEQENQDDGQSIGSGKDSRRRGGKGRGRASGSGSGSGSVMGRAVSDEPQAALPKVLDVELAPAAPGEWGDPDVEW